MRTIDRFQRVGTCVEGRLSADYCVKMWRKFDFTIVSESERLHAANDGFLKVCRFGNISQQKLICAVNILQPSPQVISGCKSQSRLGQIAIPDEAAGLIAISSP